MTSRMQIGLRLIAFVWLVGVIILSPKFIEAHRQSRDLQHVFTVYAMSVLNHNYEQAYGFCSGDFRDAMPFDRFVDLQKHMEQQYGVLRSFKRRAYEVHGKGNPQYWRGVLDADFVYENKTLKFEFVFHKESDRWVIFGYEQL